jgi:3-(3-hydroxy-phenyl)propionate hydroxylase
MTRGVHPLKSGLPVAIVGAGPVGLTTALGLAYYNIPFVLFEAKQSLSSETKAGTTLTRTLEIWQRFGAAGKILSKAVRVDEIGDIERSTNRARRSVKLHLLHDETRFPFVINLPQHDMEPVLRECVDASDIGSIAFGHRLIDFVQHNDRVELRFETPLGPRSFQASHVLACDGGRSTVRDKLGVKVQGESFPERYCLVDLKVDLDVENPRDFPYLAYFSDAKEWMILIRQPQCWRFLYPLAQGQKEHSIEDLRDKALHFIGQVSNVEVLGSNIYNIHHRVADKWRNGRVLLLGDAAHLITPMWALGLNTGILDASSVAWRMAWYLRGWGDESLLESYEREQKPVAEQGSGEMAEAARRYMASLSTKVQAMTEHDWGNAYTRSLLGVRLGIAGSSGWSMVKSCSEPPPVEVGDRAPDGLLQDAAGQEVRLHDLFGPSFVALYFTDTRRRPAIPANDTPWLKHYAVSRWDTPLDSDIRTRSLLDPGGRIARRYGCEPDTMVLVRPDDYIAAIEPMNRTGSRTGTITGAEQAYRSAIGARQLDAAPA